MIQMDREKLTASIKNIVENIHWIVFSKVEIIWISFFCTYQVDVYGFGIDFCRIWNVFNLLKLVLSPFFMVLGLFFTFTFGLG